jgi:hypothetical protein
VYTACFWNNPHQVRSTSKDWNNPHQVRSKSKDWNNPHQVRSKSKDWNNPHQVRSKSKDWKVKSLQCVGSNTTNGTKQNDQNRLRPKAEGALVLIIITLNRKLSSM